MKRLLYLIIVVIVFVACEQHSLQQQSQHKIIKASTVDMMPLLGTDSTTVCQYLLKIGFVPIVYDSWAGTELWFVYGADKKLNIDKEDAPKLNALFEKGEMYLEVRPKFHEGKLIVIQTNTCIGLKYDVSFKPLYKDISVSVYDHFNQYPATVRWEGNAVKLNNSVGDLWDRLDQGSFKNREDFIEVLNTMPMDKTGGVSENWWLVKEQQESLLCEEAMTCYQEDGIKAFYPDCDIEPFVKLAFYLYDEKHPPIIVSKQ